MPLASNTTAVGADPSTGYAVDKTLPAGATPPVPVAPPDPNAYAGPGRIGPVVMDNGPLAAKPYAGPVPTAPPAPAPVAPPPVVQPTPAQPTSAPVVQPVSSVTPTGPVVQPAPGQGPPAPVQPAAPVQQPTNDALMGTPQQQPDQTPITSQPASSPASIPASLPSQVWQPPVPLVGDAEKIFSPMISQQMEQQKAAVEQQHWSQESGWQNGRTQVQDNREQDYRQHLLDQEQQKLDMQKRSDANAAATEDQAETGRRYVMGPNGVKTPINDPTTGQPLYTPGKLGESTDDDTGRPTVQTRDQTGKVTSQTDYKKWDADDSDTAQAAASDDIKTGDAGTKINAAKYLWGKEVEQLKAQADELQSKVKDPGFPKPLTSDNPATGAVGSRTTLENIVKANSTPVPPPQAKPGLFGPVAPTQDEIEKQQQDESDRLARLKEAQDALDADDTRKATIQQYLATQQKLKDSQAQKAGGFLRRYQTGQSFVADGGDEKKNDIAGALDDEQSQQSDRDQQRQALQTQIAGGLAGPDLDQANQQLAGLDQADQTAKAPVDAAKQQVAIDNTPAPAPDPAANQPQMVHPMSAMQDFINNADRDLTKSLGPTLVAGAADLSMAVAHSPINPMHWVDKAVAALGGPDVEARDNANLNAVHDFQKTGEANIDKAFPVDESRNKTWTRWFSDLTGNTLPMLAGPGRLKPAIDAYMALTGGEQAKEQLQSQGATGTAAGAAGIATGGVYALANHYLGPLTTSFLKYMPGAGKTVAQKALNAVVGVGANSARQGLELGAINFASAAISDTALAASGVKDTGDDKTPYQNPFKSALDGVVMGATLGGILTVPERMQIEANNSQVGSALKTAGAKATFVQNVADTNLQLDQAVASGKMTQVQADQAKRDTLHFLTPENQAQVAAHADNINKARIQGAQILKSSAVAAQALGQPDPDYRHITDDQVNAASQATPDDSKLALEADRRNRMAQIQQVTSQRLSEVADNQKAATAATEFLAGQPGGAATLASLVEHNASLPLGQKVDARAFLPVDQLQALSDPDLNDPQKVADTLTAQGQPTTADNITKAQQLSGHSQNMPENQEITEQQHAARTEIAVHQQAGNKAAEIGARQKVVALEGARKQAIVKRLGQNVQASREIDGLWQASQAADTAKDAAANHPETSVRKGTADAADSAKEKVNRAIGIAKIANGQHLSELQPEERDAVGVKPDKTGENFDTGPDSQVDMANKGRVPIVKNSAAFSLAKYAPETAKLIKDRYENAKDSANARADVATEQGAQKQRQKAAGKDGGKKPEGGSWTARGDAGTEVSIPREDAKSQREAEPLLARKLPKGELLDLGSVEAPTPEPKKVEKPTDQADGTPYSSEHGIKPTTQTGNDAGRHQSGGSAGDGSAGDSDGSVQPEARAHSDQSSRGTGGSNESTQGDRAQEATSGGADVSRPGSGNDTGKRQSRKNNRAKPIDSGSIDSGISRIKARLGALNAARGLIDGRAIEIVKTDRTDGRLWTSVSQSGKITIYVNEAATLETANSVRFIKHGGDAIQWYNDALNEELIHVADILQARDQWEAAGNPGHAAVFWKEERRKDLSIARAAIAGGDKVIARAFVDSYLSYKNSGAPRLPLRSRNIPDEEITKVALRLMDHLTEKGAEIDHDASALLGDLVDKGIDVQHMSEFIRQLIQAKNEGTLTETGYRSVVGRILDWMRRVYENLQQAAFGSPELAAMIKPIEDVLNQANAPTPMTAARPPPMSDEEIVAQDKARKDALKTALGDRPTLLQTVKQLGGVATTDAELQGELNNLKEVKNKGTMMQLFRKDGKSLDHMLEALGEKGFHFSSITEMLDAIHDSIRSGKPVYGGGESIIRAGERDSEKTGLPKAGPGVESERDQSGANRTAEAAERGAREGSPEAAADLLRRGISSDQEKSGSGVSTGAGRKSEDLGDYSTRDSQARAYLRVAEDSGKVLPADFLKGSTPIAAQGEHEVFKKGDRVYKITQDHQDFDYGTGIEQDYLTTPHQYLNRFALSNKVFGDDIKWEGVIPANGHLRTVTSQPYYDGKTPDESKISAKLTGMGFVYHEIPSRFAGHTPTRIWYRQSDGVILGDTKPANFIETPDGAIRPIDVIAEQATQAQRAKYGLGDTTLHAGTRDDLFDQPAAPAKEVPADKKGALSLYNKLNPLRKSGAITGGQSKMLEQAENILGQEFIPGTDTDSAPVTKHVAAAPKIRFGQPETGIKHELTTEAPDMFGKKPEGQQSLFAGTRAQSESLDLGLYRNPGEFDLSTKPEPDKKNSTQINMPPEKAKQFTDYANSIPDADLYHGEAGTDSYGPDYGREDKPHVTVHYGLESDPVAVQKLVKDFGPIKLKLGKTSLFKNDKYDVLKVGIEGSDIHRLNGLLSKEYPVKSDFPDYTPHLTIAYLKKGEGDKYAGDARFEGQEIPISQFVFSDKEQNHVPIDLTTDEGKKPGSLVMENRGLAQSIAAKYNIPGIERSDVIQEANKGLIRAAQTYDPAHGAKFSTYAYRVMANTLNGVFGKHLKIAEHEEGSLDQPAPGTGLTREETTADPSTSKTLPMESKETKGIIDEEIRKLPKRPQAIVEGIREGKNGQEIADEMGISRQSVNDSLKGALTILRQRLKARGLEGQEDGILYAGNRGDDVEPLKIKLPPRPDSAAQPQDVAMPKASVIPDQIRDGKLAIRLPKREGDADGLQAGDRDESPLGELMRQIRSDMPSQAEIGKLDKKALAEPVGKQTIGEPRKANYAQDRETRRHIDAIQDLRESHREAETEQGWIDDARARVARDPLGETEKLLKKSFNPETYGTLSATDVKTAQLLVPRLMREAYSSGDKAKIKEASALAWAYDAAGADQARAFSARRDPFKTPAERHIEFLTKMISTPSPRERAAIRNEPDPAKRKEMLEKAQSDHNDKLVKALREMRITPEDIFAGDVHLYLKSSNLVKGAVVGMGDDPKLQTAGRMILDRYTAGQIAKKLGVSEKQAKAWQEKFSANLDVAYGKYLDRGFTVPQIMEDLKNSDLTKLFAGTRDDGMPKSDLTPEQRAAALKQLREMTIGNLDDVNSGRMQKRLKRRVDKPMPYEGNGPSSAPIPGYEPMKQDEMKPGLTPAEQAEFNRTRKPSTSPADAARYKQAQDMYDKEMPYEHVAFDPNSKEQVFQLARAMQAADGNKFDMMYEAWINSILSGPQTHVALSMGMAANAAWDFSVQRGIEALTNAAFFHDPNSAQFGEFKPMLKAVIPAVTRGLKFAAKVFNSEEHYAFERSVLNQQLEFKGAGDVTGGSLPAIPGKTGRIIRLPARVVMFQDAFFKQVIGHMEATAQAYRLGKAQGFAGADLENYIHGQVNLPGSDAWQRAVAKAEEGTFQTKLRSHAEGGGPAEGIARKVQDLRNGDASTWQGQLGEKMLGFLFPFIRTPYNIFRTGLSKTPLGSVAVAGRITDGLFALKDGKPFISGYSKAQMVKDLATQTIAWSTAAMLYGMVEGDKDDENKQFLITGSRPHGVDKEGSRDLANRVAGGPFQIRIGGRNGTYINYGRIEPFATVLGTVADAIRIAKQGQDLPTSIGKFGGYFMEQAQDKTFLQGISSVAEAVQTATQDPKNVAKGFGRQILQGLVPNLIRQPLRNLDDYERDTRNAGPGYAMTSLGGLAPKKYDLYGNPEMKQGDPMSRIVARSGDVPTATFQLGDAFLSNWNRTNPDLPYYPAREGNYTYKDLTGKKIAMTPDQIAEFDHKAGKAFAAGMSGWLTPQMAKSPTEDGVKMFKEELEKARKATKDEMFGGGVARKPVQRGTDISSLMGWK